MIYDFVGTKKYDYTRIPFFGIEDNETGKMIYMTDGNVELDSRVETNSTGKSFPKVSRYIFQNNGDSKKVEFTIKWKQEIETRNIYKNANAAMKAAFIALNIQPVYMRYYATGILKIIDGDQVEETSGDMIYEYNYMGKPDPLAKI